MPKIKNLEGLTTNEINAELNNGAKFVMFQYCISIILLTFKRSSNIYFVKAGQSSVKHSIGFTIITALFGWWGFPWGPVYSVQALYTNLSGGTDVTEEVLASLNASE